jgi:ABC-type transport system involved in cytochrome c biogenesis permease subunit
MAPADLYRAAFSQGADVSGQVALLGTLETMVLSPGDTGAFRQQLAVLQGGIQALAEARGEFGRIPLEVTYYRANFMTNSLVLFIIGFVFVALCWLLPRSRFLPWTAAVPLVVGLGLLSVGITLRCIIRGRPPVSTLYETIIFITAVGVLSAMIMELMTRRRIALGMAAIIGMIGMFLANRYEMKQAVDTMPSLVAVLDTNFWLATHVTTISIGYAAGLLAAAIAHVYIFGRLFGLGKGDPMFYRSVARMVYGTVIFCLFFSVLGTLLGGVWANESWGRFWGWDPKENGALMICLWMLAIVHAHLGGYIKDLGVSIAAVFGGIIVAFSWWGVNLLGVGLHSYGFTSGILLSLLAFVGLEVIVMALGGVVWLMNKAATQAVAAGD